MDAVDAVDAVGGALAGGGAVWVALGFLAAAIAATLALTARADDP
jgi:hypothetical protein